MKGSTLLSISCNQAQKWLHLESSGSGITLWHRRSAERLQNMPSLKDIIAMLGLEQLSPEDRNVVARARRLERFLTQPFFTTEQFTGLKGKLVSLKDSLDGCERILRDEFKDYPESSLYMIGAVDEAKKNAKSSKPGASAKDLQTDLKPNAETEDLKTSLKQTADTKAQSTAKKENDHATVGVPKS